MDDIEIKNYLICIAHLFKESHLNDADLSRQCVEPKQTWPYETPSINGMRATSYRKSGTGWNPDFMN